MALSTKLEIPCLLENCFSTWDFETLIKSPLNFLSDNLGTLSFFNLSTSGRIFRLSIVLALLFCSL